MKKGLQKWFAKNKKLLIVFGIISIITLLVTMLEISLILSNMDELQYYATTGIISMNLKRVGLLGIFNVAIIAFWTFYIIFILIKIIFPSYKTVKDAFYIDELNFLKDIPSQLRKGLDRK